MSDDIRVTWDIEDNNADGYRVYRSRDGGQSWTQASGDLSSSTTEYDDTGLLDGEEYVHRVDAFTEHTDSASGTTGAVTTDLPDAQAPSLGNGVEDEIAVDWGDTIDYGEYDIQYRETGASSWIAEPSVDESVTSDTIIGLEDGEEYEVRLRSRTEHVTGEWTTPISIVTDFPGATDLAVVNTFTTQVDLSWIDNADNEDGFEVLRAREYDDGFSDYSVIADIAADTESYSDTGAVPGSTHRYKIRPYTEHTSATTPYVETSTATIEVPQNNRTRSDGWYVEVDHPNGATICVEPVGDPVINPMVNDLPRVTIPVPRNEKWQNDSYNEAEMRVWKDGQRQPIEQLEHRKVTEDATRLVGIGGVEFYERIRKEVGFDDADAVARDIVGDNTGYTVNVDDPSVTTDEGSVMSEADTGDEWSNFLANSIADDEPATVQGSALDALPIAEFSPAEDYDSGDTQRTLSGNTEWQGGESVELRGVDQFVEFEFTFDHDIPAGEVGFAWRYEYFDGSHPEWVWTIDGEEVNSVNRHADEDQASPLQFPGWHDGDISSGISSGDTVTVRCEIPNEPGTSFSGTFTSDYDTWVNLGEMEDIDDDDELEFVDHVALDEVVVDDDDGDPIESTYTEGDDYEIDYGDGEIRVLSSGDMDDNAEYAIEYVHDSVTAHDDSGVYIDCVTVYDQRYIETLATGDMPDSNGDLSWPNIGPDSFTVETQDYSTPFTVVGGGASGTWNATGGNQAIAVSNDQGQNWTEETNSSSVDEPSFDEGSPQIRGRFTLSYHDDGTTGTTKGGVQSVDVGTLTADLDDTPTVANWTVDGRINDILGNFASDRNFVWELRWDDDADTLSFEMCQPGQRTSTADSDVISYQVDKQTEDLVEQMTVFGSAQPRRGEEVTVQHGTAVDLDETDLVERKEAVLDRSQDPTEQYTRGEDYEMGYLDGEITALDTGNLSDGQTIEVDYEYRIQGTYPSDADVSSDPREDTQTIVGLGSSRICEQTAYYIVQRTNTPIHEAEMTIPTQEVGWSVINEIDPDEVPTADENLQINEITENEGDLVLSLASRRTTRELVNNIRSGVESVSRRV